MAKSPKPKAEPETLRTDGPTLAEYVAAGYKAENYPPRGYASKEPVAAAAPKVRSVGMGLGLGHGVR